MTRRLPAAAQALLRLLGREARERATADLQEMQQRVEAVRGSVSAKHACSREAAIIVLYAMVDGVRRMRERTTDGTRVSNRRPGMLGDFGRDVRIGTRNLIRRPGFTLIATGVLALGVGATTTIFTLFNRLFLEAPPHVERPAELIRLFRSLGTFISGSNDHADYLDYRERVAADAELAAASSGSTVVTARLGEATVQVNVRLVSENWFGVLGTKPVVGRFFDASENSAPMEDPLVVVSWEFWRTHLAGSPSAVGRDLLVNGRPFTVIGVAPRGFRGFEPVSERVVDLYMPIMMAPALSPPRDDAWYRRVPDSRDNWLSVVGRLQPGGSIDRVQTEIAALAIQFHPAREGREQQSMYVTRDFRWSPGSRKSLLGLTRLMMAAVSVLLLVAASNVAILLLARASTRGREVGIRAAIGAGKARLVKQLLTETLLLGLGGAVVGLLFAIGAVRVAIPLLPVPLDPGTKPDSAVLMFSLLVSLATALAVGVVPALRSARSDVVGLIQGRTRHAGGSRLRDGLIVSQIALSLVLVAGATLFARSLGRVRAIDPGFDTRNTLVVGVQLGTRGYEAERIASFRETALSEIAALPGVEAVTVSRMVPFRGDWSTTVRAWPGATFAGGVDQLEVGLNAVGTGYFDAMGIPILRGRPIDGTDGPGAPPVIVVNEAFARAVSPDQDMLGQSIPMRGQDQPSYLVAGIAKDARYYEFDEEPRLQVYAPIRQVNAPSFSFIVKTTSPPLTLVRGVHDALHRLDPDLALPSTETMESVYALEIANFRTSANVIGTTGLIALLLSSAGLYGVMAFRVTERTREIGLRMALGATRRVVARDVVARGVRLTLAGVMIGIIAALATGRLVQGLLFGVGARDPASLTLAPIVLLITALVALLVPARRAMSVDPMRAMRSD